MCCRCCQTDESQTSQSEDGSGEEGFERQEDNIGEEGFESQEDKIHFVALRVIPVGVPQGCCAHSSLTAFLRVVARIPFLLSMRRSDGYPQKKEQTHTHTHTHTHDHS